MKIAEALNEISDIENRISLCTNSITKNNIEIDPEKEGSIVEQRLESLKMTYQELDTLLNKKAELQFKSTKAMLNNEIDYMGITLTLFEAEATVTTLRREINFNSLFLRVANAGTLLSESYIHTKMAALGVKRRKLENLVTAEQWKIDV